MGLAEAFQQAAQAAVKAVGNVAASAVYRAHATTTYNATTGTPTTTYSTTAGVKVVIDEFRFVGAEGADLDVRVEDRAALIPALYISGVTPAPQDAIDTDDGATWVVINVFTDPAQALWRLQVRRP